MNETPIQPPIVVTVDNTKKAGTRKRSKKTKNLLKRGEIWYFVKMVKGKRRPLSLETTDLTLALAKRDALLAARSQEETDRVLGLRGKYPKLGAVIQVYLRSPMIRAKFATRQKNVLSLFRLIRAVKGADCEAEALSTLELTWELVEQWQTKRLALALAASGGNLVLLESAKRGLNSTLQQVQSVFSDAARQAYRSLYLPPNIADFSGAVPVPARKQEEPVQLSDQDVVRLIDASGPLRDSHPALWAAFQLMTWGGLRNTEALHARRSWLTRTLTGYLLRLAPTGDFTPKGNSREVMLPFEVGQALLSLPKVATDTPDLRPDDHLVPAATLTLRTHACYRDINAWLKQQGVAGDAGKFAYRLRKYFLKKVAVQQHPLMAQVAAGHSSLATTTDHYIGKPKMTEPIRLPVDLARSLSFSLTEKPGSSALVLGAVLDLAQAAQLLEVNAGELAARAATAESVMLDGFMLTVRREGGINGRLVPPPVVVT